MSKSSAKPIFDLITTNGMVDAMLVRSLLDNPRSESKTINTDVHDEIGIKYLIKCASLLVDEELIKELEAIDTSDEPLLADNPDMFSFGDMNALDDEENELYKDHQKAYWPAEEVSMVDDQRDWINLLYDQTSESLTEEQRAENKSKNDAARRFLEYTIAFFAAADGIVNADLVRLVSEITNPYVKKYYRFQMMMEDIHAEAYAIMLKALVPEPERQHELFRAIYKIPVVKNKALFALKYISHPDPKHYLNQPKSLALRLVALSGMEMIQFSSSFASIYWIRSKGKMPGLSEFNKQIARDEGMHGKHSCIVYNKRIKHRLSVHVVYRVITEAYNTEKEFFTEALPVELIGINAGQMDTYVRMICIRLSEMLGYPPLFPAVKNPFPFMEKILLNNRNNLHEIAGGDYQNAMIQDAMSWGCLMNF